MNGLSDEGNAQREREKNKDSEDDVDVDGGKYVLTQHIENTAIKRSSGEGFVAR